MFWPTTRDSLSYSLSTARAFVFRTLAHLETDCFRFAHAAGLELAARSIASWSENALWYCMRLSRRPRRRLIES